MQLGRVDSTYVQPAHPGEETAVEIAAEQEYSRSSLHRFDRARFFREFRGCSGINNERKENPMEDIAPADSLFHLAESPSCRGYLKRTIQTLGLVYGDLGTSTLYTVGTLLASNAVSTEFEALSAMSMIFWLLILVPTLKYITFVLTVDHNGEGGAFAMFALLQSSLRRHSLTKFALVFSVFGAAFLIADGAITPAVTVVSAIEGIQVGAPSVSTATIVGVSIAVLFLIFAFQSFGSGKIGLSYGPIMLVWFSVQAALGIYNITKFPAVFKAINPLYALRGIGHTWSGHIIGYLKIGSALLTVTGSEAMYADIGHFGKTPMRIGWIVICLPCLLLQYFGQVALIISNPEIMAIDGTNVFFKQIPSQGLWPLIIISTLASVIASQAAISGTFSVLSQAVSLNLFPRVSVKRTAVNLFGQVYMPEINFILMIITLILAGTFQTSSGLTSAYGVTVSGSFLTTTILFTIFIVHVFKTPLYISLWFTIVFGIVDLLLFTSALTKVPSGGYAPLVIGLVVIVIMLVWRWGVNNEDEIHLTQSLTWEKYFDSVAQHENIFRTEDTFVFLTSVPRGVPIPLTSCIEKVHSLGKMVVLLTIRTVPVPFVDEPLRFHFIKYDDTLFRVVANIGKFGSYRATIIINIQVQGYMESNMSVRDVLDVADRALPEYQLVANSVIFIKGRIEFQVSEKTALLKRPLIYLFTFLKRNSIRIDSLLKIPADSIEIGRIAYL
eukprot:jgi/Galph1/704/GphlegSOOS_G5531.1